MTKNELITIAANSKMLKGLSINLCNKRDIANDLFQEFLLILCEKPDSFLINKFKEAQFISYCSNVIKGLNSNRYRDSKSINTKNPLVERHTEYQLDFDLQDESYNFEIEHKFNKTIDFLEKTPSIKKHQVLILFSTLNKTTKEISESIGTKERVVIYQNNKLKEQIRLNVK